MREARPLEMIVQDIEDFGARETSEIQKKRQIAMLVLREVERLGIPRPNEIQETSQGADFIWEPDEEGLHHLRRKTIMSVSRFPNYPMWYQISSHSREPGESNPGWVFYRSQVTSTELSCVMEHLAVLNRYRILAGPREGA